MTTIRFLRDYTVKPDGPIYRTGETVDVTDESAEHFMRRGAAEKTITPTPPAAAPMKRKSSAKPCATD